MKLGYPCINWTLGCSPNKKFRLASYSDQKLLETVTGNLEALEKTLAYNAEHKFLFFRISSDSVPFASHPICTVDWLKTFSSKLAALGDFVKAQQMRISMHPDQFVLINTPRDDVRAKSVAELEYHAAFLDAMKLDSTAKIQIHVGGVYGDKPKAIDAFVRNYHLLPEPVRRRLVIEHDDKLFSLKDALEINAQTSVPILFDAFHHRCLNNGETMREALIAAGNTWKKFDGVPMVDYSDQDPAGPRGKHASTVDEAAFKQFLIDAHGLDRDIILEIRDKELSAARVLPFIPA